MFVTGFEHVKNYLKNLHIRILVILITIMGKKMLMIFKCVAVETLIYSKLAVTKLFLLPRSFSHTPNHAVNATAADGTTPAKATVTMTGSSSTAAQSAPPPRRL